MIKYSSYDSEIDRTGYTIVIVMGSLFCCVIGYFTYMMVRPEPVKPDPVNTCIQFCQNHNMIMESFQTYNNNCTCVVPYREEM